MEELKIIMEAVSKIGNSAQTVFITWCIKEVCIYMVFPISLIIIGKTAKSMQKKYFDYEEKRQSNF